jgi:hypothetical protein
VRGVVLLEYRDLWLLVAWEGKRLAVDRLPGHRRVHVHRAVLRQCARRQERVGRGCRTQLWVV